MFPKLDLYNCTSIQLITNSNNFNNYSFALDSFEVDIFHTKPTERFESNFWLWAYGRDKQKALCNVQFYPSVCNIITIRCVVQYSFADMSLFQFFPLIPKFVTLLFQQRSKNISLFIFISRPEFFPIFGLCKLRFQFALPFMFGKFSNSERHTFGSFPK